LLLTAFLFIMTATSTQQQMAFSFSAGTMLLLTFIFFWRYFFIRRIQFTVGSMHSIKQLSQQYFSFNPSNAITPILFIAAGIFTVFITGANKMDFNAGQLTRTGGTGGYLLWCDLAVPVKEDMNSPSGRQTLGLDEDTLKEMTVVQIKRSSGNDASCLNLNHITAPPLLGVDPGSFITAGAFRFSTVLKSRTIGNPWQFLKMPPDDNTIFGIADQTVLEWGLKLKTGDTLRVRSENGQPLNIIIAGGLQSSVFQGNVLIGKDNFSKYYPSVSGSSILLVDGREDMVDTYRNALNDRLSHYGINTAKTNSRLASFYSVTNTYLSVFAVFGALGMIVGIIGLGFVLLRNYNTRRREFALMLVTGFHIKRIRGMIMSEQLLILFAGVVSGVVSALAATLPSISNNHEIPWLFLTIMVAAIIITGYLVLLLSLRSVHARSLRESIKSE
jgi:putative ABC transport system permease protein